MPTSLLAVPIVAAIQLLDLVAGPMPDLIYYQDAEYIVVAPPLKELWKEWSQRPGEQTPGQKGWRALWNVQDSKLYLVGFKAKFGGKTAPSIGRVISTTQKRLHATWYTGKLTIGAGEPTGSPPKYKRLVVLEVEKGIVVRSSERTNADKDRP